MALKITYYEVSDDFHIPLRPRFLFRGYKIKVWRKTIFKRVEAIPIYEED